ncbi:hypothetical protein EVAR_55139_1 [Eumeta japonica]|uniref:Uncharacterized protein n=1 Tax=Eumeta variegata TaxID=151549 RepID=A0A4C1Y7Z1_EUMVA|nr:hypothetical protein EVAR_55139_1 [Eumeta japonica]
MLSAGSPRGTPLTCRRHTKESPGSCGGNEGLLNYAIVRYELQYVIRTWEDNAHGAMIKSVVQKPEKAEFDHDHERIH